MHGVQSERLIGKEMMLVKNEIIFFLMVLPIIAAFTFIGLHLSERTLHRGEVAMISSDIDYVVAILKKRNAGDCVIEPTTYGWKCTDFNGRVYKIKKYADPWQGASLSN